MALRSKSMFLYGLEVRSDNQNLPFRASMGGPQLNAVIPASFYSLTSLIAAVATALQNADPSHIYTVTVDRTVNNGTENRITIKTNGSYLDLLFATGTTAANSIRDLIGFGIFDYTGNTTYTNGTTSGTALNPDWWGKNYLPPDLNRTNFGTVNVATNGEKEAITWSTQLFIDVEFENEPEANALAEWPAFIDWMIQQKPFDFTPLVTDPSTVYQVTLEKSSADGKGLGFKMKELLPDRPFLYTTGPMTFRVRNT
jgi:hypothetical protein